MPRIKITLTDDVHALLKARAEALGCPLSDLIARAAIEKHLGHGFRAYSDLEDLSGLLSDLRAFLEAPPAGKATRAPGGSGARGRTVPTGELLFPLDSPPVATTTIEEAIAQGLPVHRDRLRERLVGNPREVGPVLATVGGRGDDLYLGSYNSALKVAASTAKRDPEGLSWFPVDRGRAYWIVETARGYTERIWQK